MGMKRQSQQLEAFYRSMILINSFQYGALVLNTTVLSGKSIFSVFELLQWLIPSIISHINSLFNILGIASKLDDRKRYME